MLKPDQEAAAMSETTAFDVTSEEAAEYEATFNRYIAGMELMKEEIEVHRRETARLKEETETMLKDIIAILKVA
jgi:hypothetical protein